MVEIFVNGQPRTLAPGQTVAALLLELGLEGQRLAVELNGEVMSRGEHAERELRGGDKLEIVHAIGGG